MGRWALFRKRPLLTHPPGQAFVSRTHLSFFSKLGQYRSSRDGSYPVSTEYCQTLSTKHDLLCFKQLTLRLKDSNKLIILYLTINEPFTMNTCNQRLKTNIVDELLGYRILYQKLGFTYSNVQKYIKLVPYQKQLSTHSSCNEMAPRILSKTALICLRL